MSITILEQSSDGVWGVIVAKDFPGNIGRSKTRDDPQDALNATWDAGLTTPVGPGSIQKYIKVRISDLTGAPRPKISLNPGDYANKKGPKFIPDYPHKCAVCGGKMLILFSSQEHEGGKECPGPQKRKGSR